MALRRFSDLAHDSVGITAKVDKNGTIHVLDLVRGRWEFPDLVHTRRTLPAAHASGKVEQESTDR